MDELEDKTTCALCHQKIGRMIKEKVFKSLVRPAMIYVDNGDTLEVNSTHTKHTILERNPCESVIRLTRMRSNRKRKGSPLAGHEQSEPLN